MNLMPLKNLIKQVRTSHKQGKLDQSLLNNAHALKSLVEQNKEALQAQDPYTYFKTKCMIYEVRDYFNLIDADESRKVCDEATIVAQKLPSKVGPNISTQERRVIREKVRFCVAHANELYRANYYEMARDKVLGLYNFVLQELSDETLPCFGTLAQVTYFLGKAHRQMAEYDAAEKYFAESIDYCYRRAELKDKPSEYAFSSYKAAVALGLGIGWVNFTRGYLTRALYNITPARLTLCNTGDIFNRAYLDLMYGSIKRSQAGLDHSKLQEAIRIISKSFYIFQKGGHKRFLARAAFELALAFNLIGDSGEAERALEIVEQIAEERHDHRWQAQALVVRSRIQRNMGKYSEALESAELAFKKSEMNRQALCMIDALIARGEAKIALRGYAEARHDFEVALSINEGKVPYAITTNRSANPKVYAVCHLYIARSYALEGHEREAKEAFQKWDKAGTIEHMWIHYLAESVKSDIDNLGRSFFIRANENLNYKERQRELREWLLEQAELKEPNNISKRAQLLGITRSRLSQIVSNKSSKSSQEKNPDS